MPATVQIIEKNGAGGTPTNKTSGTIRFKNADNATVDLVNPMRVVAGSVDWSFEKWVRLNVTGGTYEQITNVAAYFDGTNGLGGGVSLYAKAEASYATPAEGTSATGYSDAFGYDSEAPLSLGAGPFTGAGEQGSHLVMLLAVDGDEASGGMTPTETLTIAWDEI